MTVAPDSLCAMSSGVWKQYGSQIMALFRLVGSKQMWSFGIPVFLSCDSTKMKLLIHGVASWTGLITPAVSIFSISCLKVCLRWTGMGLQGVCLGVMDRFVWIMIWLTWKSAYTFKEFWDTVPWFVPLSGQFWFSLMCCLWVLWA